MDDIREYDLKSQIVILREKILKLEEENKILREQVNIGHRNTLKFAHRGH